MKAEIRPAQEIPQVISFALATPLYVGVSMELK
jgi:hypothetical protein